MEPWRVVMGKEVLQWILSARDRARVIRMLDELGENPGRKPTYTQRDQSGRVHSVWAVAPFLVTYWLDDPVKEVRIVAISRVRNLNF